MVLAISFDFAKAFDLGDHEILLEKISKHGVAPLLISWIASYLIERRQRVVINSNLSEWKPVEASVIQGSIIGPILFLVFIIVINECFPLWLSYKHTLMIFSYISLVIVMPSLFYLKKL